MRSIAAILTAVAAEFGLDVRAMRGESRIRELAHPRFLAMLLARREGYSFQRIANSLGRRDHTTVIYGVRRAAELVEADPEYAAAASRVVARLAALDGEDRAKVEQARSMVRDWLIVDSRRAA